MIFGVDNLEALNNGKVMARRGLSCRQIVFHGAGLLFHHHRLLGTRGLHPIMAYARNLARAAAPADTAPRAETIQRSRLSPPL
jgi:hypothetical protein